MIVEKAQNSLTTEGFHQVISDWLVIVVTDNLDIFRRIGFCVSIGLFSDFPLVS